MLTTYRLIFTCAFTVKADRDAFQTTINTNVGPFITGMGIATRVAYTPDAQGRDPFDLSGPSEKGYCWFDSDQNAIWASRLIVGFTSLADCNAFSSAAISAFSGTNPQYHYYRDAQGKIGAFNADVRTMLQASDLAQTNMV